MDKKYNIITTACSARASNMQHFSCVPLLNISWYRRPRLILLSLLGVLLISACSIHQKVAPVPVMEHREICIINNPDVQSSFLESYQKALEAEGLKSTVVDESAGLEACQFVSTYTANWRWDLAMYMAFAEIKVYKNGEQVGSALYDSLGGSGNMNKFISADLKIQELVDQLFPNIDQTHQPAP